MLLMFIKQEYIAYTKKKITFEILVFFIVFMHLNRLLILYFLCICNFKKSNKEERRK